MDVIIIWRYQKRRLHKSRMSKLFFDHLVELKEIDKEIKKVAKTSEERQELWMLVDEIVHHKALGCILDQLPRDNHEEFLELFHKSPYDEDLLFGYLKEKIGKNVRQILKTELGNLAFELLEEIRSSS